MLNRGLGFHPLLELCPSDTANTVIFDEAAQAETRCEGAGVSRAASTESAHETRGLIQPDTCNTVANGSEAIELTNTNKTCLDQVHVVAASGT